MNVLIAIDHIFQRANDGQIYTTGGKFPYEAWQTYLEQFDQLTVFSRGRSIAQGEEDRWMSRASGERVRFCLTDCRRGAERLISKFSDDAFLRKEVEQADAIVARLPSEYGLAAVALARAMGKPYLVELVACPWDALWHHGALSAKLYAPILAARTRRAMKSAPFSRYVTRGFLQARYPSDGLSTVASNVMLAGSSTASMSRRLRRFEHLRLGRSTRPLTFGTIGALHTRLKGVQTAIAALSRARGVLPEFEYRVLGEGDAASFAKLAVKNGVGDSVYFDGVLPAGAAVEEWLDGVDIYLQPSFQEGLPRGLIEALSRGCMAVGSTAGGIPELLPHARLHRPGDVSALARRITQTWDVVMQGHYPSEISANVSTASNYEPSVIVARRRACLSALRDQARAESYAVAQHVYT